MLKKTIKYKNWDGTEELQEDVYFNLSKAELADMNLRASGTLMDDLEAISKSGDGNLIMDKFRDILEKSYGVRSEDGKRFIKSPELFKEFTQTAAYDEFFFQLVTNPDFAAQFMNGLVPSDLREQAEKLRNKKEVRADGRPALQDHLPKKTAGKDNAPKNEFAVIDAPQELMSVNEPVETDSQEPETDTFLIQAGGDADYADYLRRKAQQG